MQHHVTRLWGILTWLSFLSCQGATFVQEPAATDIEQDRMLDVHPWLWQDGCYNLTVLNSTTFARTNFTYNAPGPCVDFCLGQNKNLTFIGLQMETCLCISEKNFGNYTIVRRSNCSYPCPGNPYHFCGNHRDVSSYSVEANKTSQVDKCVARNCSSGFWFDETCDKDNRLYCGKEPVKSSNYPPSQEQVHWLPVRNVTVCNTILNQDIHIAIYSPVDFKGGDYSKICPDGINIWVRAFDKYAPVVCQTPDMMANATVPADVYAQVGDWANYTCKSGYNLSSGVLSRRCLTNGSFDGADPVCLRQDDILTVSATTVNGIVSATATSPASNGSASKPAPGVNISTVTDSPGTDDLKFIVAVSIAGVECVALVGCLVVLVKERNNLHCCKRRTHPLVVAEAPNSGPNNVLNGGIVRNIATDNTASPPAPVPSPSNEDPSSLESGQQKQSATKTSDVNTIQEENENIPMVVKGNQNNNDVSTIPDQGPRRQAWNEPEENETGENQTAKDGDAAGLPKANAPAEVSDSEKVGLSGDPVIVVSGRNPNEDVDENRHETCEPVAGPSGESVHKKKKNEGVDEGMNETGEAVAEPSDESVHKKKKKKKKRKKNRKHDREKEEEECGGHELGADQTNE